ncbi:hypothetical protein [Herbaspirillum chlorophenolicum]|uniref:hypothetical protein n=1 Tax=Herbaspirillum chlorophenolicum TaxID=211589 RepID=UPI000A6BA98A|nr:hypothetical protein [Herbaspirillum chlorophenolicum]
MADIESRALTAPQPAELAVVSPCLPAMAPAAIEKVRRLEALSLEQCEQVEFPTAHLIHGGMYARTLHMSAGTVLTGALLKIPTVLIVAGDCAVFIGEETIELRGYNVLPGSAGRKQVFLAHTDVDMTMFFPSKAGSVGEAEQEFTDEYEMLMTHRLGGDKTLITGE